MPERPALGFATIGAPRPSLDWVLAHLTGVWAVSGEMVTCPLPGHEDSTPSFNLWDDDPDGVPTRWGCFGCDRRGDVVDLVAEMEGLSPPDALRRSAELREVEDGDITEHKREPKARRELERPLDETYAELVKSMGSREYETFQTFMKSKGLDGEDIEAYAMDEWGWVADARWIAMPHRTAEGFTAIKFRAGERRRVDGHFPALYGTWRDAGRPRVLICEGETDTLWAAWQLREDETIDVLGLPAGAKPPRAEWLDVLTDREVTIAFDADDAGMRAARRWCEARPDIMVARLPEGEDLLSCGLPVAELLDRATVPMVANGMVVVDQGVFAKKVKDGATPVADFSFTPVRELKTEEGPAWEGRLSGARREVLLRSGDLLNGTAVTRWANSHGRSWTGGSGPTVQWTFNYLTSASAYLPLEVATNKAGRIDRSFVGPGFCIGADRTRYIPPVFGDVKLESRLRLGPGEWDRKAIAALERLNDPSTMAIILGWLCASLLRGKNAPAPPLFVAGESGAGKTNMLNTVLGSLGFATETNLTTTTPYGVDSMVNSCVGFPIWFDEYRGGARVDSMERLRQLLRDAYYGQPSMKGGMRQQATELTEVSTWAGIVVSGEMSTHETSHRDRLVMLDLDPDAKQREPYRWLQDRRRTAGMGRALLEFLAYRPDTLFRVEPQGREDLPDRFRETMGFVEAGWSAWKHFRWEQGLRDVPTGPNLEMLTEGRREAEDPWLQAIKACEGVLTREGYPIVEQQGDDVVIIPSEVVVEARRVGIELPARANEMVAWLRRRYEIQDDRVHTRRAKRVSGMRLGE